MLRESICTNTLKNTFAFERDVYLRVEKEMVRIMQEIDGPSLQKISLMMIVQV